MEAKKQLKHLIIYCNPNPKSLSAVYKEAVMELTEMSGNAMNVRDLYNIGFHPVLEQSDFDAVKHGQIPEEVKVEQDYIQWVVLFNFIYPICWTCLHAFMIGFIDRVFTKGFAYNMDEEGQLQGLLAGKKVVILNNMGFPYDYYDKIGMLQSMKQTSDQGIFEFCGIEVAEHRFFGHLDGSSKSEREAHVNVLKLIYDKLLS